MSSPAWEAIERDRLRSDVLGYAAVTLLREHPDPRGWSEGPAACAFLREGGNPDEWEAFRGMLVAEDACHRVAVAAPDDSAVARMSSPIAADPAAYARSLQDWFAARGDWACGGCTGTVRWMNPSPRCPWPSFDDRLARGDYLRRWVEDSRYEAGGYLAGRWGESCCSWDELEGCPWYPRPRCSLRTRELERPACFGLDWDERELRRVFAQSADPAAFCLDGEGFLRTGRLSCEVCPERDRLFGTDEIDPSRLEGVA